MVAFFLPCRQAMPLTGAENQMVKLIYVCLVAMIVCSTLCLIAGCTTEPHRYDGPREFWGKRVAQPG